MNFKNCVFDLISKNYENPWEFQFSRIYLVRMRSSSKSLHTRVVLRQILFQMMYRYIISSIGLVLRLILVFEGTLVLKIWIFRHICRNISPGCKITAKCFEQKLFLLKFPSKWFIERVRSSNVTPITELRISCILSRNFRYFEFTLEYVVPWTYLVRMRWSRNIVRAKVQSSSPSDYLNFHIFLSSNLRVKRVV